ncbi:MAG: hypothetical protein HC913_23150 [Microscillaceae bacterium]|nr:hypothetical protein [Microscillaceae bacterium]
MQKNALTEAERATIEEHLDHCKHLCEAILEGLYLEELTQASLQSEPSLREAWTKRCFLKELSHS